MACDVTTVGRCKYAPLASCIPKRYFRVLASIDFSDRVELMDKVNYCTRPLYFCSLVPIEGQDRWNLARRKKTIGSMLEATARRLLRRENSNMLLIYSFPSVLLLRFFCDRQERGPSTWSSPEINTSLNSEGQKSMHLRGNRNPI